MSIADQLLSRCTFSAPGSKAYAAVSGGADSLALLVLARAWGLDVTAVHVDHGLRPGSEREAEVVEEAAYRLGAGFRAVQISVPSGPNLEARAREARHAALPEASMTGHTADDQAETVLMNLARGAGLDGLAAMRAGPTKPILALRRSETEAICEEMGFVAVVDPSNRDLAFTRNRIRHEVLPLMSEIAKRDVVVLSARSASLLSDDATYLSSLAECIDPLDSRAVAAAPLPLARRAIRKWLSTELPPYPPEAAVVERVLAVAQGRFRSTEIGSGWSVSRSQGRLTLRSAESICPTEGGCPSIDDGMEVR